MRIQPGSIRGALAAPTSKSDAQRAIAAACLADGLTIIRNVDSSDDVDSAMTAADQLGARCSVENDVVHIAGTFSGGDKHLSVGESGLSLRLFSCVASTAAGHHTIDGRGTLLRRPIGNMIDALNQLGAVCETNNGSLPLKITGPLHAGRIVVDGAGGSQHVSGLLMCLPTLDGDSEIRLQNPTSVPYIRMTLSTLEIFGVRIACDPGLSQFFIPGAQEFRPTVYDTEGDWSSASYFLVGGALLGEATVTNLALNTFQADIQILDVLRSVGAEVSVQNDSVTVRKSNLRAFEFDAHHAPDLIPTVVVLAGGCEGTSIIHGISRLFTKESNRAEVLFQEFQRIGLKIRRYDDRFEITGGSLPGGLIRTYNDHRIAMSAAIAGLISEEGVEIDTPECAAKSYPAFFSDLDSIVLRS